MSALTPPPIHLPPFTSRPARCSQGVCMRLYCRVYPPLNTLNTLPKPYIVHRRWYPTLTLEGVGWAFEAHARPGQKYWLRRKPTKYVEKKTPSVKLKQNSTKESRRAYTVGSAELSSTQDEKKIPARTEVSINNRLCDHGR